MRIRVGTLCSGYDSQCMSLDRLKEKYPEFDYELIFWSEIDKYAIQAHNAVYPQWADRNLGDMTKIEWESVPQVDLLCYSTPCQDVSSAGKQKGIEKGSGTRSSILWYTEEAIRVLRPKYLLMENVSALVSEKFRPFFLQWEQTVAQYGYNNYSKLLNSKSYGVPQNRERIFMVSILNADQTYYWPEPFKLETRLKDVLEQNVDEKYYLSDKVIESFNIHAKRNQEKGNGFGWKPTDGDCCAMCIKTSTNQRADDNYIIEQ